MDKNIIHKGGFHRRSIRIPGFDYCSEGSYFITIVTRNRYPLFGEIIAGDLRLTQLGQIAQDCWREIPSHFSSAEIDEFVIMPNHIHGILNLINDESDAVEIKVVKSEISANLSAVQFLQ